MKDELGLSVVSCPWSVTSGAALQTTDNRQRTTDNGFLEITNAYGTN
jgi:hypothetical protein